MSSTAVSTQQIQDLPVASRRWIDLAMLTPGTSQDNIRGQFYRGNVNVGAGAPRILERLRRRRRQQHLGRDGRAAPELRDGRDPGVQGLDVDLQGGVRPGDRRCGVGGDQVGHQPAARLGPAVLPRRVDHREGVLPDDQARLPPLSVRRHHRRADREGQDALLLRLRGDEREPVLHRERARPVAPVRRARSRARRNGGRTTSR